MLDVSNSAKSTGLFLAVVGASGVGKDTVLNGARDRLKQTGQFYFPTRLITRPRSADTNGEKHQPLSDAEFVKRDEDGEFSLSWAAHGLQYALPNDVNDALASGVHIVANVSRQVVEQVVDTFDQVRVIEITASPDAIRNRLLMRGRESEAEIVGRETRAVSPNWSSHVDVTSLVNDGDISQSVDRFIKAILSLSARPYDKST